MTMIPNGERPTGILMPVEIPKPDFLSRNKAKRSSWRATTATVSEESPQVHHYSYTSADLSPMLFTPDGGA